MKKEFPSSSWAHVARVGVLGFLSCAGTLLAEPPDIANSSYYLLDFYSGFDGRDDTGGWGKADYVTIDESDLQTDGSGNISFSSSEVDMVRLADEDFFDFSSDGDADTRYSLRFSVEQSNRAGAGNDTFTVSESGRVSLTSGDAVYTGLSGDVFVRWGHEFDASIAEAEVGFGMGLRLPTAMSNADMAGDYVLFLVEQGFIDGPEGCFLVTRSDLSFDGMGGVSENYEADGFSRFVEPHFRDLSTAGDQDTVEETRVRTAVAATVSDSDVGSYSVTPDGELAVSIGGKVYQARVGADGETAILADSEFSIDDSLAKVTFGFGVKKASGMTNTDVAGTYLLVGWEHVVTGGEGPSSWGEVSSKGKYDTNCFPFLRIPPHPPLTGLLSQIPPRRGPVDGTRRRGRLEGGRDFENGRRTFSAAVRDADHLTSFRQAVKPLKNGREPGKLLAQHTFIERLRIHANDVQCEL